MMHNIAGIRAIERERGEEGKEGENERASEWGSEGDPSRLAALITMTTTTNGQARAPLAESND